jgi:dimethylamine--corrinoid protein Co-methyltransferase
MALAHAHASGMGGMRTTGDLVARMQMTRGMKIQEAKAYVANKLKLSIRDLTDPVIMTEVRQDLKLGVMSPQAHDAIGIEAKFRIAEVLDIDINCVNRFKNKVSFGKNDLCGDRHR